VGTCRIFELANSANIVLKCDTCPQWCGLGSCCCSSWGVVVRFVLWSLSIQLVSPRKGLVPAYRSSIPTTVLQKMTTCPLTRSRRQQPSLHRHPAHTTATCSVDPRSPPVSSVHQIQRDSPLFTVQGADGSQLPGLTVLLVADHMQHTNSL